MEMEMCADPKKSVLYHCFCSEYQSLLSTFQHCSVCLVIRIWT